MFNSPVRCVDRKQFQPLASFALLSLLFLTFAVTALSGTAGADDWPQWRGPTRDGVWRETGIIDSFERDQIPIVWEAEISSGYSGTEGFTSPID